MSWQLLLFLGAIVASVAAVSEVLLSRGWPHWTPRRRVFTSAVIGPGLLLAGSLALAALTLITGSENDMADLAAAALAAIGVTASVTGFMVGLLVAYLLERKLLP
ncbi:hypothetical protein [Sphingomonas xanthus]|uniref:Uncharacterized protein n=1 Tax=Sphingomonas xanthus TaxID=2594473 RepID=A0A516IPB0_9SPHN|nr:hypothetical protein [Sphingomonas xanthus]QDP18751.1 hypothetical protein FMM02_01515 [Sphingomonas xanthus]